MEKETVMSVITISRGSYSHGREVAEALAEELGYQCISGDILMEASDRYNIPETKLERALHDAPSFFERFYHDQERYVSYYKSAFLSHMAEGDIVYHGLAGHFFLQGVSHALKVRITAHIKDRVQEEMRRESCSGSEALNNLRRDDEARRKWGLQLYGQDTCDSRLYDMVLCADSLSVSDIVELLSVTIRKEQFQETEQSKTELHRRLLLANVQAQLAKGSPNAEVNLINNSVIELRNLEGQLRSSLREQEACSRKLKEEFGFRDVIFKEGAQPHKGYINTFYNLDVR